MSSSMGSGRGRRVLFCLAIALGLPLVACGTNPTGLPVDADLTPPPPPPPPDSGPRQPPVIQAPDAGQPDSSGTPGAPDGGLDTGVSCPATNLQPTTECTFGYHPLKKANPEVVLVFDRSSSMLRTATGSSQTRWNEMVAAVDDSVKKTASGLSWGLKLFPSIPAAPMCAASVSDGLDVPVGLSNYDPLVTRIRGSMPAMGPDGSPLDLGIKKAAAALRLIASSNPRYLVFASDGVPNCPVGKPGQDEAIKTIDAIGREGLRTFVIGTTTATSPQHRALNDMAAAGGEPRLGDQRYYQALNKAEMQSALDEITGRLTSCVLKVNALPPAPDWVALNIGNTRIPRDTARQEGWNWGGSPLNQVVHVYGKACEELKTNPLATAELVFGCVGHEPPVPPPCSRVQ
jgi:hypothetical protein